MKNSEQEAVKLIFCPMIGKSYELAESKFICPGCGHSIDDFTTKKFHLVRVLPESDILPPIILGMKNISNMRCKYGN